MKKIHFLNKTGNDEHSLARRRFLIKGALIPLIPMAAILPSAMSMNVVASSGVTTLFILKNGTRFNGLGQDLLLAMQHLGNGYRIYNPTLMRFQAMDSLSPFHEGGVHSYAYVSNDPVNLIDPSGHIGIMAIIGFVGLGLAVVGTALAITANVVSNNHKNYAESIKPDWTWEHDWSEYDSSMQAANDWGVAATVGIVTAAVGGAVLLVAGGAAAKTAAKGAKAAAKSVKKGIGKATSKMFSKKTKPTSPVGPKRSASFSGVDAPKGGRSRRAASFSGRSDVPYPGSHLNAPTYSSSVQVSGFL